MHKIIENNFLKTIFMQNIFNPGTITYRLCAITNSFAPHKKLKSLFIPLLLMYIYTVICFI